MSQFHRTIMDLLDIYEKAKTHKDEQGGKRFTDLTYKMRDIIGQHMDNIDQEMKSTHILRGELVKYFDELIKCSQLLEGETSTDIKLAFDKIGNHISESSKFITLIEHELEKIDKDHNLLKE